MVSILIEDLKIKTIIGVLDSERTHPQTLIINAKLDYEYEGQYLDYVHLVHFFTHTLQKKQYKLLEEALNDLIYQLHLQFPSLLKISVKLQKPDILDSCIIGMQQEANFTSQ